MKKLITLTVFISIGLIKSENLNLFMFLGCEQRYNATTFLFEQALKNEQLIPNYAILISEGILSNNINRLLEYNEYNIKSNWTAFEVPNNTKYKYYLLIKNNEISKFESVFQIKDKLKKIELDQISVNKLEKCEPTTNFDSLSNALFIKNKTSEDTLNIFLSGHGEYKATSKELEGFLDLENKNSIIGTPLANYIANELLNFDIEALSSIPNKIKEHSNSKESLIEFLKKYNINATVDNVVEIKTYILNLINLYLTQKTSTIAYLNLEEFSNFLRFLDKNINIEYLYIVSCYAGGANSIFAYINKPNLEKKLRYNLYNFSIINASASDGVVLALASDPTFELFKFLIDNKLQNLSQHFWAKFRFYVPMIRPKNQSRWFPVFRFTKKAGLVNTFDITKNINDKYESENKIFKFDKDSTIFVSTPCITTPIELDYYEKQFSLRPTHMLIKKLVINMPSDSLLIFDLKIPSDVRTILKILLRSFFGVTTSKALVNIKDILGNIIIEDLTIKWHNGNITYKNVFLLKESGRKLSLMAELDSKFHMTSAEDKLVHGANTVIISDSQKIDDYKDNPTFQELSKKCLSYGTNIKPLIKHLEKLQKNKVEKIIQECLT